MAALVAGVRYGLSSQNNFHENKSLIYVKLTDSAQRAIENFLKNRNSIDKNPTIQFLGDKGEITFPALKSNTSKFTFSLSNNQDIEGPQGGFECIQQTGPKNLESLGALPCKMRIHANDDVYQTTKHRLHIAEENNKNKCTRVIKANEAIGKKVKIKSNMRTSSSQESANSSVSSKLQELTNISNSNQPSKLMSSFKPGPKFNDHKKFLNIKRRPLKERLIHVLALKPFKKPELYDRIMREGIEEKDKNHIAVVLKQISFLQDNAYHLQKFMWNEVKEDWPFYTEKEKAILKQRRPPNRSPPNTNDRVPSCSSQSPRFGSSPQTVSSSSLSQPSMKRSAYDQIEDEFKPKKQRISHNQRSDNSYSNNIRPIKKFVSEISTTSEEKKPVQPSQDCSVIMPEPKRISHIVNDIHVPSEVENSNDSSYTCKKQQNSSEVKSSHVDKSTSEDHNDYHNYYTTIISSEQRTRYKMDFNAYFEEYQKLHEQVVNISEKFCWLQERLKSMINNDDIEGSEAIKQQIIQEYAKTKADKNRFKRLHDKLNYIKSLISEYDEKILSTDFQETTIVK